MKTLIKYNNNISLILGFLIVTLLLSACSKKNSTTTLDEDKAAKKTMQGVWTDELEGNIIFSVKDDTIYYNDSQSEPAFFYIYKDTLFIKYHNLVKYPIRKLTDNTLVFIDEIGDEIELVKNNASTTAVAPPSPTETEVPNQGKVIKKDTVVTYGDKRYHAYKKVNPTSYKVYIQTKNDDGLSVENTYYDNIVHIALYIGHKRIFGQNITKAEFKGMVPDNYLEQAILSDVSIKGANKDGVTFVAILTIPDTNTTYRINIIISPTGEKTLSL
jgi:hypothetical protein